jgi:hypothetical protein
MDKTIGGGENMILDFFIKNIHRVENKEGCNGY